jgi:hypothetical protein
VQHPDAADRSVIGSRPLWHGLAEAEASGLADPASH